MNSLFGLLLVALFFFFPPSENLLEQSLQGKATPLTGLSQRILLLSVSLTRPFACRPLRMLSDTGPVWSYIQWPSQGESLEDILYESANKGEFPSFFGLLKEKDFNVVFTSRFAMEYLLQLAPPPFRQEYLSFIEKAEVGLRYGYHHMGKIQGEVDIFIRDDLLRDCGRGWRISGAKGPPSSW